MDKIDIDGNYLIIEKMMPDRIVDVHEFALKSCTYMTSSESFVIVDLSQIQRSFIINFGDVANFTNFDGIIYDKNSLTAFLRQTTGSK